MLQQFDQKLKKKYYKSSDLDNDQQKMFWTTVKPCFCKKIKSVENIALNENWTLAILPH